jgi:hypothetical protein
MAVGPGSSTIPMPNPVIIYDPDSLPFLPPILNIHVPRRLSLILDVILILQILENNTGMLAALCVAIIDL